MAAMTFRRAVKRAAALTALIAAAAISTGQEDPPAPAGGAPGETTSQPASQPATEPAAFKVATYNINFGNADLESVVRISRPVSDRGEGR